MNLSELQRAFQQHILAGDTAIAGHVTDSQAIPAAQRLSIYSDAYRLRLADALAQNYPRLRQWLGAEAFEHLARDYLDLHPSSQRSVRWLGHELPNHLASSPDHAAQPWLAELARWEWAIATAFDAPDSVPLNEAAIGAIDPSLWPTLQFGFDASLQLLRLDTNAPALFKALSEDASPPEAQRLGQSQSWLIWRYELTPRYRSLAADEAGALQSALDRGTFSDLCNTLCEWHAAQEVPVRAASLLKAWLADRMLTAATPSSS